MIKSPDQPAQPVDLGNCFYVDTDFKAKQDKKNLL